MINQNVTRTDSSIWDKIKGEPQIVKGDYAVSQETLRTINSNQSALGLVPAGEIKLNPVAVRLILADNPKSLADLMQGGITIV